MWQAQFHANIKQEAKIQQTFVSALEAWTLKAIFKKYNQRHKLIYSIDLQITKLHALRTLQILLPWSSCLAFHSSLGHMKLVKNAMLHTCTDKTITYSYSTQALFCGGLFKPCKPNTCNDHPPHHKIYFHFNCHNINFPLLLAFYS